MSEEIIELIKCFFKSFDTRSWEQMESCLNENLELDYQSFRGAPKYNSTSKEYIEARKIGMEGLRTEHNTSKYLIVNNEGQTKCICEFEIKRYEIISDEYYHSFGKYEIWLKCKNGSWKIFGIKQVVERNEGNKDIHGAFRK